MALKRASKWAFHTKLNPSGVGLKAICSSDIDYWEVLDMTEVVEEAYALVGDGLIIEADFRDFIFAKPASFYAETNPDFFKGTAVDGAVEALLSP
jgi:hypothetical protein